VWAGLNRLRRNGAGELETRPLSVRIASGEDDDSHIFLLHAFIRWKCSVLHRLYPRTKRQWDRVGCYLDVLWGRSTRRDTMAARGRGQPRSFARRRLAAPAQLRAESGCGRPRCPSTRGRAGPAHGGTAPGATRPRAEPEPSLVPPPGGGALRVLLLRGRPGTGQRLRRAALGFIF